MYSQQELDDAVAAGALTPAAADSLRAFVEGQRAMPMVDEEQVRLVTGFNDIFVTIASAIMLFAMGAIGYWLGQKLGITMVPGEADAPSFLVPALVAGTSWMLATYFTGKRRMALPSILLTFSFVIGVFAATAMLLVQLMIASGMITTNGPVEALLPGAIGAVSAAVAAGAAWLHWRAFRVPVTVAAGAVSAAGIVLALVAVAVNDLPADDTIMLVAALVLGLGIFALAMRWDGSDKARTSRRSDVAFWLHLAAAPMIVHPIFTLLGLNDGSANAAEALAVIALYVVLGITALAIDRRALLVSALAYVLFALTRLFETLGAVELNVALTALVIGSALLTLSAFWHQARRMVVTRLPNSLEARLPYLDRTVTAQPAA